MKKSLLLCAALLCSLLASAGDGIVTVGANITVLPATQYDGNVEWKAWTWVWNTGVNFGDPKNNENPFYNLIFGTPSPDAAGHEWFEPEYDMAGIEDLNADTNEPIVWEEHAAPFSTDEKYNGRPSYRWTTGDIMADIYIRRTFTTDQLLSGPVYLACGHDDGPSEYYINGVKVFEVTDGWNNNEVYLLTDEQKALIKLNGEENIIAVHVHQNWGGAFADCGLYTKVEGGLEMGYVTPWEGKVLFNNHGGYNFDGASPSNNPKSPWSKLYEALEGDEYTFTMEGASDEENPWMEQIHFKTPIKIEEGHNYDFSLKLASDADFNNIIVKLCDNNDDELILAEENDITITAGEETEVSISFEGLEVNDFKIAFDFGGGQEGATVTIKEISLTNDDDEEMWVGTHYFNYFYMCKADTTYWIYDDEIEDIREAKTEEEKADADIEVNYVQINAPELIGRTETMAWTLPDFDDSMWDDQMMPVGNSGYMAEVQTIWPQGTGKDGNSSDENSNYWIRRNFTLDKVNERLSYALNVCHDDVYETYVNGHLLQKNVGWTNGKNPVQVHIPARYLNEGKNVIATYIEQNWGGKFYDCGINVEEVNYEECANLLREAIAYADKDTLLTNKMKEAVKAIKAEGENELATNKDAAEVKNYAKEMKDKINAIFAYSNDVKVLKETVQICQKIDEKSYWGTTIEDAIAALDTCATARDLDPYRDALRTARKRTALERHNEKYVGCTPEVASIDLVGDSEGVAPKYYIYNVGEKLFLGGGESWGAHAALEYISNPMMLVEKTVWDEEAQEDVTAGFRIETFRANGAVGEADFLNYGGFTDTNTQDAWKLIPVEGKENVFNIARFDQTNEDGSPILLGFRNGTENGFTQCSDIVVDTDMKTAELESNQWMFITREEMLSFTKEASSENPVDLSFLINNPGYDQRLSIEQWMVDYTNDNDEPVGVGVWGRGGNNRDFVFEAWSTTSFTLFQDLWTEDEALPAGSYMISVQGYYRDGHYDTHVDKVVAGKEPVAERAIAFAGQDVDPYSGIFGDGAQMNIMPFHIEANKAPGLGREKNGLRLPDGCDQAANDYFENGLYQNKMIVTLTEPGHISFGIYKEYDEETSNGDWVVVDNWRIKYLGAGSVDPDAIQDVTSDEIMNAAAQNAIYNLLGQKLTKVQKGVNIIGGKKIVKK